MVDLIFRDENALFRAKQSGQQDTPAMARPAFPTAAANDPAHDTENAEVQASPAALLGKQDSLP